MPRRKSTAARSKSPVRKSPPKTRSRATTKKDEAKKARPRTPESAKKKKPTPVKVSAVKQDLSAKLEKAASNDESKFSHKLIVLRIQYGQLFLLGLLHLAMPQEIAGTMNLKPAYVSPGLAVALQWFGMACIGIAMLLIAAAQGSASEMKKALQYTMMFWMLGASLAIHQRDIHVEPTETMFAVVACLFNLSIALW
eukprot:CAMPEP_0184008326 /NCGR_PEP_ID=MMETSP0954-20121128/1901_1 /TAXON_ID=627963 /ORGANISM="Aplanochytrium sp, Strain PBS07" /LENGTH=195 /DNA_ID=CAMNT_0026287403 /DNA_START=157 /DNA_END=741 /DNA_ORIENTATION=-